jgi:hypothetical protein
LKTTLVAVLLNVIKKRAVSTELLRGAGTPMHPIAFSKARNQSTKPILTNVCSGSFFAGQDHEERWSSQM